MLRPIVRVLSYNNWERRNSFSKRNSRTPRLLTFDPSQRAYVVKVNLLTPKDTATRHLFGRSIKFNLHTLEERFPASVDTARLRVYDLQSYCWLLQRDTWTKKYPTRVPLTAIHEIVVFERQRLSKADYQKTRFRHRLVRHSSLSPRTRCDRKHRSLEIHSPPSPRHPIVVGQSAPTTAL